jgi:hypothetical protein
MYAFVPTWVNNKRQMTTDSIIVDGGIVALDNDINTVRTLERENKNCWHQSCAIYIT